MFQSTGIISAGHDIYFFGMEQSSVNMPLKVLLSSWAINQLQQPENKDLGQTVIAKPFLPLGAQCQLASLVLVPLLLFKGQRRQYLLTSVSR